MAAGAALALMLLNAYPCPHPVQHPAQMGTPARVSVVRRFGERPAARRIAAWLKCEGCLMLLR